MSLLDQLSSAESSGYFDPLFRKVLEEHLPLIKSQSGNLSLVVTPVQALRYKGDYFGLLSELSVPDYLKWITMRMNGFISPTDVTADVTVVMVPDDQYIRRLYNTHRTQMKVKKPR